MLTKEQAKEHVEKASTAIIDEYTSGGSKDLLDSIRKDDAVIEAWGIEMLTKVTGLLGLEVKDLEALEEKHSKFYMAMIVDLVTLMIDSILRDEEIN